MSDNKLTPVQSRQLGKAIKKVWDYYSRYCNSKVKSTVYKFMANGAYFPSGYREEIATAAIQALAGIPGVSVYWAECSAWRGPYFALMVRVWKDGRLVPVRGEDSFFSSPGQMSQWEAATQQASDIMDRALTPK